MVVRPHVMRYRNLIAVLVVLVTLLCGCTNDVLSSSHATRADAADTISRGWIPAVLPASATEIHETHNLDSNTGHGTFRFDVSDMHSFQAALLPIPVNQSVIARSRDELESFGYVFYTHGNFDIAVNWEDRTGQFWLGQK